MPLLLIPGFVFLSALVLVALANTANVQTKAQTESQQTFWGFLGNAITGKAVVHQITQATRSAVSRWALAQLRPVTAWFVAFNALILNIFRTRTNTAEGTADAIERLRGHTIPNAAKTAAAPGKAKADAASRQAHKATATATATATSFRGYRTATAPKLAHATRAVDVTLPAAIGRLNTREGVITKDIEALRERTKAIENGAVKTFDWIKSHPLSGATAVFTGAVAVALSRLGFGFLRCRSWQSLGRRMTCGTAGLLDDLLFAAIETFAVLDICDFANAAESLALTFQSTLMELVDVENALVGCHGATAAPLLSLPTLHLPPQNLGLALAG